MVDAGRRALLIDPGTYAYWADKVCATTSAARRRTTRWNSSGRDQSDSGGRFMWTRHANARLLERERLGPGQLRAVGVHDGYGIAHRRELRADCAAGRIEVVDRLPEAAPAALHWHLARAGTAGWMAISSSPNAPPKQAAAWCACASRPTRSASLPSSKARWIPRKAGPHAPTARSSRHGAALAGHGVALGHPHRDRERMNPNPTNPKRITLMGCQVDNLSMEETLQVIDGFIRSGRPHQHVVVNVDKIVKAQHDAELRNIINGCDLINADGMPVVWASRWLGMPLKERVAGVDLFEALMQRASTTGWRVYLLGARSEVVQGVKTLYERKYPGLTVAGARDGYWKPEEEAAVVETIAAARPDILFVAISSPKKEQFLGRWQAQMKVPFAMGVGGTFDVAVGKVKRAPVWMQNSGLEWFYRFLQEPRRMFRRYFIEDMAFLGLLWGRVAKAP